MGSVCEECGIFAVAGHPKAAEMCYCGLYALQHRGQESAGIACRRGAGLKTIKGPGLISDVFEKDDVKDLQGDLALGHVRCAARGGNSVQNAQPITVQMWRGMVSIALNGNLVNAGRLRADLEKSGSIFQTTSHGEVVAHLLARSQKTDDLSALADVLRQLQGAYSLGILASDCLLAARDPHGFRPLSIGEVDGAFVISSETSGLDAVGARVVRDVGPGEIACVGVDRNGGGLSCQLEVKQALEPRRPAFCVFEYIYFARPDSDFYGHNVHAVRKALGRQLARRGPAAADFVTGVPDSSLSAAAGFAEEAGLPYEVGLVKNRYIGRTFISPEQSMRESALKIKLNPLRSLIKGKRVVLVDDSIVRGTTSRYIVGLLRSAGAKEVHLRISSPPFRYPCYYGIDTPSSDELVAAVSDTEAVRRRIGANSLVYLDVEDLRRVLGNQSSGLCYSCFNGDYPEVCREGCES